MVSLVILLSLANVSTCSMSLLRRMTCPATESNAQYRDPLNLVTTFVGSWKSSAAYSLTVAMIFSLISLTQEGFRSVLSVSVNRSSMLFIKKEYALFRSK